MKNKGDGRIFIYWIDEDDNLVKVNEDWLAFAADNKYVVLSDSMVKKPLWNFIADMETQHLYKLLLQRVRDKNVAVKIPFRCDAPNMRRFMELEFYLIDEKQVEFRSRVVKIESRTPVHLLDAGVDRSDEFVIICSWCKKVFVSDTEWVEVEEAIKRLDLFGMPRLPQLTHGMCPGCKKGVTLQMQA